MWNKHGPAYARRRRRTAPVGYVVVGWSIAAVGWVVCATMDIEFAILIGGLMLICGTATVARAWILHDHGAALFGLVQVLVVLAVTALVMLMSWGPGPATRPILGIGAGYLIAAAPWAWRLWKTRVEGFPPWQCQACGYALVGLHRDNCPECGQDFDAAKVNAAIPPEMLGMTSRSRQ